MNNKKRNPGKSFGIIFCILFLIIAIWPEFNLRQIKIWALVASIVFLFFGIFAPKYLIPFNNIWIKFGEFLGKFIAPIVKGIVYFFVITPISIMLKIFKKDLLRINFNSENTYWISRKKNVGSMKKQF